MHLVGGGRWREIGRAAQMHLDGTELRADLVLLPLDNLDRVAHVRAGLADHVEDVVVALAWEIHGRYIGSQMHADHVEDVVVALALHVLGDARLLEEVDACT